MKKIPECSTSCQILKKKNFQLFIHVCMCFTRLLVKMYFLLCVALKKFQKTLWTDRGVLVIVHCGCSFPVFERLKDRRLWKGREEGWVKITHVWVKRSFCELGTGRTDSRGQGKGGPCLSRALRVWHSRPLCPYVGVKTGERKVNPSFE